MGEKTKATDSMMLLQAARHRSGNAVAGTKKEDQDGYDVGSPRQLSRSDSTTCLGAEVEERTLRSTHCRSISNRSIVNL